MKQAPFNSSQFPPLPYPQLQASSTLLNYVFCLAWVFEFSAFGQGRHGISKLEKMSPVWPPHKAGQQESSFIAQVSSSWRSSSKSTLSVRGIHYIGRPPIIVVIVITAHNTYVINQNLQNAFSAFPGLIIITNLWVTHCYPHFTDKYTEKLDDLSKVILCKIDPIVLLSWSIAGSSKGVGEVVVSPLAWLCWTFFSTWGNNMTWGGRIRRSFPNPTTRWLSHTQVSAKYKDPLSIIYKMEIKTQAGPLWPLHQLGPDVLYTQHS